MGTVIFNGYKPQCSFCMRTIAWHMRPPDTYTCECGTLFNLEDVKDSIVWKDSIGIFNHEPAGAIMSLTHLNEEAQELMEIFNTQLEELASEGNSKVVKLVNKNDLPKCHEIKPIEWEHTPSIEFTRLSEPLSREDLTNLFDHIEKETMEDYETF